MALTENNSLKDQFRNIAEEARMVLPGIQGLFGFQTIAVFNQRFTELPQVAQTIHCIALILVIVSIALIMSPAAWHRMVEPECVSEDTVRLSSRLLCAALLPLAFAIALDIYVVLYLACKNTLVGAGAGTVLLFLLLCMWYGLPLSARARRVI